ncbi:MAG: serine/threonine protein kinase [Hyphomicrobiales bacterium]|nr:MAG: serine/threonine protein kinase [Hyphomicrobiales bacterium]
MYVDTITPPTIAASQDELPPGAVLFHGQYVINSVLASGGFGITYCARDHAGQDVVIKECFSGAHCRRFNASVRPRSAGSQRELSKLLKCFLKEARSLSSLTHPNVVRVHQVFQENDTAYMVMERIRGNDLLDIIDSGAQRTPAWMVTLSVKMIAALAYIHEHDILHRDISPDNIFINQENEPVLIDFGAASWISDGNAQRASALTVVKDGYSPHELYFQGGNVGRWTDVYSLGASLYHAITGLAPLDSQTRIAARAERAADPLAPLAGNHPGYPAGFLESIDKALSLFPADRYQTAESWLEDLRTSNGHEDTDVKLIERALGIKRPIRPERIAQPPISSEPKKDITTPTLKGKDMALDITGLNEVAGFIGGCLVDSETGMMLAAVGGGKFDLEAASAANTEVVRAKNRAIQMLGLDDSIEDILITLGKQYHLIRPMEKTPTIFLYVALDKKIANLGLARVQVKKVEQSIAL